MTYATSCETLRVWEVVEQMESLSPTADIYVDQDRVCLAIRDASIIENKDGELVPGLSFTLAQGVAFVAAFMESLAEVSKGEEDE